jgi:hypothetical protein
MSPVGRRSWCALAAALMAAAVVVAVPAGQAPKAAPPAKKNPLLKLVEPWPTPEQMQRRRIDAEARPLFTSDVPLEITLAADFKAVNKDHDPNSRARYPGELRVDAGGHAIKIPVKLSARGHVRRMARTCNYVPLRVEFPKEDIATTVFAHQSALKLVVQCAGGGEYEQYLLREFLAYRIFNVITNRSFRARLVKVTYAEPESGKTSGPRYGMFLEDDADVAKRMEGRIVELPRLLFSDVDMDSLMPMMVFQYMIGNTDFSIFALHNVRIVQRPDKSLHPVPYDFDYSGLVNAPYATPARGLMLKSVIDRYYRGPCRRQEQVDPILANFIAKKESVIALPAQVPGLDRTSRDTAKSYLDEFYRSIANAKDAKRLFVTCPDRSTM